MEFDPLAEAAKLTRPSYYVAPSPPRVDRADRVAGVLGLLRWLEGFAAAFLSVVIALVLFVLGYVRLTLADGPLIFARDAGLMAGAVGFGLPHVALLLRELASNRYPVAIEAAAFVRRLPVWVRLVSAPYWLIGFMLPLAASVATRTVWRDSSMTGSAAGDLGLITLVTFLYCLAANSNLVALLAACGAGEARLRWWWRGRLLVDAAVTVIGVIVSVALHR